MLQKIEIFERNERKYFTNIALQALRNSKNQKPLEFQMHYKNRFPSAIIQSYPEYKIFRNFQRDTIGTEVIKVIDSLKIRGVYNSGDTTQLEFWHNDEYVILYRNKSYKNVVYYKNRKRIDVVKNWKYFSFQLKTD